MQPFGLPEWRNWYTHQTQNLARFTPHVGSSPTSGIFSIGDFPMNFREIAFLLAFFKIKRFALFALIALFAYRVEEKWRPKFLR